jgi:transposase-like protein
MDVRDRYILRSWWKKLEELGSAATELESPYQAEKANVRAEVVVDGETRIYQLNRGTLQFNKVRK